MSKLENDISFLKGVGPARADLFRMELGIRTWEDLLMHYPFRYVDKSQFQKVRDVKSDAVAVQLQGTIVRLSELGEGRAKRLVGIFQDETGTIVWCMENQPSSKGNSTLLIRKWKRWNRRAWPLVWD
ncbi:MAG: ATP-dependent helicase RecG [Bacteroidota bacterium]